MVFFVGLFDGELDGNTVALPRPDGASEGKADELGCNDKVGLPDGAEDLDGATESVGLELGCNDKLGLPDGAKDVDGATDSVGFKLGCNDKLGAPDGTDVGFLVGIFDG